MSTSLFALLDDITSVLDQVAGTTKVAAKKTAGVLGDDLALSAEQVSGAPPSRELHIIWAVAKGSALNKVLLVPLALGLSAWTPWLIAPLMLLGGAFLCFEGAQKLIEGYLSRRQRATPVAAPPANEPEGARVRGAIRTDLVLSAEIIVLTLGAIGDASLAIRALTLVAVSALATISVYGLVALIVKLDDLGLTLRKSSKAGAQTLSRWVLRTAPLLMRTLSVVGTAAVFLVGGGILSHGVERIKDWSQAMAQRLSAVETFGPALEFAWAPVFDASVGLALGGVSAAVVHAGRRAFRG